MTELAGWGAGAWGSSSWGAESGELLVVFCEAVRENCVRIEFSEAPLFNGLLTPNDGSSIDRYSVAAVSGASLDGEPVRPVLPVFVELADVAGSGGRFVDVWVDRPFTGYPALYSLATNGLVTASGGVPLSTGASALFFGARAGHLPPTAEHTVAGRDLLIAQTAREYEGSNVPGNPPAGIIPVDAAGDYASGTPLAGYRTRVIRRAVTVLGSFASLPRTYGTRLSQGVKRPMRQGDAEDAAAQIEAQVRLEPETLSVSVTTTSTTTGLVYYRIEAMSRVGSVDVTVPTP